MITKQESTTAKLCAFARAYHSNFSKEKIFDDYLAKKPLSTFIMNVISELDIKLKEYRE